MSEAAEGIGGSPWILCLRRGAQGIDIGAMPEAQGSDMIRDESERIPEVEFEPALASHILSPSVRSATPDALATKLELKSVRREGGVEQRDSLAQHLSGLEIGF
jgi:hypothetical protein